MRTTDVAPVVRAASGYLHPGYAESLGEFGSPRAMAHSKGWILARRIPGSAYRDAMGPYPIFVCQDWSRLEEDLEQAGQDLVCLYMVTDPFGAYDTDYLRQCFRDVVAPFKEHFVADLSRPLETFVHSHHRRNARRALAKLQVEKCASPIDFLDDWISLYGELIERHNITGLAAFSKASFAKQLVVPGMVAFRAVCGGATVGMVLWYEQDNRAYYHLGAYSARGYELLASFALFEYSIKYFALRDFEWLSLGSEAGAGISGKSGLSRFKEGWSTGVRTAYFCGRIFEHEKYEEILKTRHLPRVEYFPAYRVGEFRSN